MHLMQEKKFYGYKHWTLEEIPRCFYVGKGLITRPEERSSRNKKWHGIVKRLGLRVEVCVGPISEDKVFQWETFNIVEEGTFTNNYHHNDDFDIGCNFTYGGEGASGYIFSKESRAQLSKILQEINKRPEVRNNKKVAANRPELQAARQQWVCGERNGMFGKHHSEEAKQKISDAHTGTTASDETKLILSNKQKEIWARPGVKAQRSKKGILSPRCKPINYYTLNYTYVATCYSIQDAEKRSGVTCTHISQVCKGRHPQAKGFYFWFVNECDPITHMPLVENYQYTRKKRGKVLDASNIKNAWKNPILLEHHRQINLGDNNPNRKAMIKRRFAYYRACIEAPFEGIIHTSFSNDYYPCCEVM